MLEALPKEIILEILQYLNFKDLNNVSQASKSLFSMATYPSLWKNFDFRKCNNDDRRKIIAKITFLLPRRECGSTFKACYTPSKSFGKGLKMPKFVFLDYEWRQNNNNRKCNDDDWRKFIEEIPLSFWRVAHEGHIATTTHCWFFSFFSQFT